MPTKVIMPQLGESVDEGTVTRWLKSIGDPVEEYEPLLEINTDKVDTEIPSPSAGVLLVTLTAEGTVVTAGTILAWIGQPGEEVPAASAEGAAPVEEATSIEAPAEVEIAGMPVAEVLASAPVSPASPGRDPELGFISPVVARIANEHNIELRQVSGSGKDGRITKGDVLAYIESLATGAARIEDAPPLSPGRTGTSEPGPLPGGILPLTPVRRSIAQHMVNSKRTSPHVTTVMEVDLTRMIAHRKSSKDSYARDGVKLTFTPYFIAAAVSALKTYPIANSSWSEDGILLHAEINIGMATSLGEEGLIVPVIKNADTLSLLGLARAVNDLADRARAKKLLPDEVRGGTFTITNHGISGSLFAAPIINQPQCGILGVGAIQKRVVVISDEGLGDAIAIRPMAYLSLTFDHRILDGAIADYFLAKIVETLQYWG